MALLSFFRIVIVCVLISSTSTFFAPVSSTNNINGFTIDLIHRDSPNSPFYKSSETQVDRLQNSVGRFFNRINSLNNRTNNDPTSSIKPDGFTAIVDVYTDNGLYVANLSIGTPPAQYLVLVDTGSSLTWTQCLPCESCFSQPTPIFDPKLSSSYKQAQCGSPACALLSKGACGSGGKSGFCTYDVSYVGESFTKGLLSSETFKLGSATIENLVFGCGTNNALHFLTTPGISGVLGLNSDPASLISQLSTFINGRFSYCLVPIGQLTENRSSKMMFGTDALVKGDGVLSTPLVVKPPLSMYFITLQAVGVGSEIFEVTSSRTEGNMLVDTGTTYTTLPTKVYEKVADSLMRQIQKPRVDDPLKAFKLCFAMKDYSNDVQVTLYFPGGGLKLDSHNFLTRIREDVMCFSFFPHDSNFILGNMAQMNVWVGLDITAKTLNLVGADCSTK